MWRIRANEELRGLYKYLDKIGIDWTWSNNGSRKVKYVKCTLVQSLRLYTGRTAHRGSRGIALPFHEDGTIKEVRVKCHAPAALYPGKDPVPIVQEAGWTPGPIWTGAENLTPPRFDPRTVQPVASHYNDWANRPTGSRKNS